MRVERRSRALIGLLALTAAAAASARAGGSGVALVKLQAGRICLGWRPHGPGGGAILAGGYCDRAARFSGAAARRETFAGFDGAPVPAGANATVPGWTPMRMAPAAEGAVWLVSPPSWPAHGVGGGPIQSCLTLHRQADDGEGGPLTADILPCERDASDQAFDVRRIRGGGSRIISRQRLENGQLCLTRPARPGPPATFTPCSDDPAQRFVLTPAPTVGPAPLQR